MMYLSMEIVERDILMDKMIELENEQDERILSNDYLIIENVLYEISITKKIENSFFYRNLFLTRHGGNFQISSFLSAGCNFLHFLQLNISLLSRFSHLINDSRQSSNRTIEDKSSPLESFVHDRADFTLG